MEPRWFFVVGLFAVGIIGVCPRVLIDKKCGLSHTYNEPSKEQGSEEMWGSVASLSSKYDPLCCHYFGNGPRHSRRNYPSRQAEQKREEERQRMLRQQQVERARTTTRAPYMNGYHGSNSGYNPRGGSNQGPSRG